MLITSQTSRPRAGLAWARMVGQTRYHCAWIRYACECAATLGPPPYVSGYGTSLAAPHVAGAVALLISAVPELRGRVDLIEMLLKTSAEPRASSECTPGGGVPNNVWGWGMLNVYQAVLAAQALELGAIEGQVVEAGTLEPLEDVTLTFTDIPWIGRIRNEWQPG